MKKNTIIDNEDVSLYCYPDKGIVHYILHKFIWGEEFRNLLTKGADVFIQENCNKWLSNEKGSTAIKKTDIKWGKKNWVNRILNGGWDYWALIIPKGIPGKLNRKNIVKHYRKNGVKVNIFRKEIKGLVWLINQGK